MGLLNKSVNVCNRKQKISWHATDSYIKMIWTFYWLKHYFLMQFFKLYCGSFVGIETNIAFKIWVQWKTVWVHHKYQVQFSSANQSCPTLCDPMNRSTPGLPVHRQLPEFTQTHVHRVRDAIQPSHRLSSPSPPAPNPSQHQSLFQWVNSLHEVAKVLEFQL